MNELMSFNLETSEKCTERLNNLVYEHREEYLTRIERMVLLKSLQGKTYGCISYECNYSEKYLTNDVGARLWRLLTEVLGQPISKTNYIDPLTRAGIYPPIEIPREISAEVEPDQNIPTTVNDIYIERPPLEDICKREIKQPHCLLRIKAPFRMGNTLLINQISAFAESQNFKIVHIDMRRMPLDDLNRFLKNLCLRVGSELGLSNQINNYWDEEFSCSKNDATNYFQDYLLAETDHSVVLVFHKLDKIYQYEQLTQDFGELLRSWHDTSKTKLIWQKLKLILSYNTECYVPLDISNSPFGNVGLDVRLPEFNCEQIRKLAQKLSFNLSELELENLQYLLGGHPFLLAEAFKYLKNNLNITVEQMLDKASTTEGIYIDHLRNLSQIIEENPSLKEGLKQVIINIPNPVHLDDKTTYQLESLGLIKIKNDDCVPRFNLYTQYFNNRLN